MKERTFDSEIRKRMIWKRIDGNQQLVPTNKYDIRTHNAFYIGRFIITGRKCYCRGCGKIIGKDVKKFQRDVLYTYGRRGEFITTFNYCYKCVEMIMKEEFKECFKFINDIKKELKKMTRADKIHSNRRMKEEDLIQQI